MFISAEPPLPPPFSDLPKLGGGRGCNTSHPVPSILKLHQIFRPSAVSGSPSVQMNRELNGNQFRVMPAIKRVMYTLVKQFQSPDIFM